MCDARYPDGQKLLALVDGALACGEFEHAGEQASRARRMAVEAGDAHLEAEALLRIARADTALSRLRSAHEAAHGAVQLFEAVGDTNGEVRALVTYGYAASCLRHNESAVSATLLATRLAQRLGDARLMSAAFNALGIAMIANGDFVRSEAALRQAILFARQVTPAVQYRPQLNRCYGEIVRASVERHLYGHPPDAQRLEAALAECVQLVESASTPQVEVNASSTSSALLAFARCFAAAWRADPEEAAVRADEVAAFAAAHGRTTWLHALAMWARCEAAQVRGEQALAEASVRSMIDVASRVEHEQIVRTGHMLAARILDAQGRSRDALDELRALARRDIEIRRGSIEHHERVAMRQLELRERSLQLRELEAASRKLEQWSLEDPLTGLPNRRHLEQALGELLALRTPAATGPTIALIDVDRFKEINDRHSHGVGDAVLKALAQLLRSHVRHADLPARLAGDEFVIVFRNADLQAAAAVCSRLERAVAEFDWSAFGTGVGVGISVGIAEAQHGDTMETLLGRSDQDMYRAKNRAAR